MNKADQALQDAAGEGDARAVAAALASGANPLAVDGDGQTALMFASWFGHAECVRALLPVSDPLAADKNGMTALMRAVFLGRHACVMALLPVSDPLAVDKKGRTALMMAREIARPGITGALEAWEEGRKLSREIGVGQASKRKVGL